MGWTEEDDGERRHGEQPVLQDRLGHPKEAGEQEAARHVGARLPPCNLAAAPPDRAAEREDVAANLPHHVMLAALGGDARLKQVQARSRYRCRSRYGGV